MLDRGRQNQQQWNLSVKKKNNKKNKGNFAIRGVLGVNLCDPRISAANFCKTRISAAI
eukprot:COSAG01_NODE_10960_length_2039_cov_2.393299_2_plen_57_part_01